MSEAIGKGYIEVVADKAGFDKSVDKLGDGGAAEKAGSSVGGKLAKGIAAAAAGAAAISFFKGSFAEAEEAQKVTAQTAAVLASTGGAAGVTAKSVDDLAGSISKMTGIDDEAIAASENLLLTFTDIKNTDVNKVFDRATKATVDMAAALGGDAASQAITLGKALNDPVAGIAKLTKVGVVFTDSQKDQIKAMAEAGDVAGAQSVILDELAKEFGGSAEAQATGAMKMNVAWGNFQETIGTMLMPVLEKLMGWFTTAAVWLSEHQAVLIALGVVIGVGLVAAFVSWAVAAATAAAATLAAAAPIIAIGVAIAALAAGVIYAYTHWGWFKTAVDAVADAGIWLWQNVLKPIGEFIGNTLVPNIATIVEKFIAFHKAIFDAGVTLAGWVVDVWKFGGQVIDFFQSIPGKIEEAFSKLAEIITAPFRKAFGEVQDLYDNTIGKLGSIADKLPGKDGGLFDGGLLGRFRAAGGPVRSGQPYVVGERRPELFVPDTNGTILPSVPSGGTSMTNYFYGVDRPKRVVDELAWMQATGGRT